MAGLLKDYTKAIPAAFPSETPILIGYDNINIYRGKARFPRLKKAVLPVMWNLTVRMARRPVVSGIEHLWASHDTARKPQKDIMSLTVEDIILGILHVLLNLLWSLYTRLRVFLLKYYNMI